MITSGSTSNSESKYVSIELGARVPLKSLAFSDIANALNWFEYSMRIQRYKQKEYINLA
jgi:hypothetical protein